MTVYNYLLWLQRYDSITCSLQQLGWTATYNRITCDPGMFWLKVMLVTVATNLTATSNACAVKIRYDEQNSCRRTIRVVRASWYMSASTDYWKTGERTIKIGTTCGNFCIDNHGNHEHTISCDDKHASRPNRTRQPSWSPEDTAVRLSYISLSHVVWCQHIFLIT